MRCFLYFPVFHAAFLASLLGFEKDVRPIIERSCIKCHGGEKVKGKVDFSKILTQADAEAHFEFWETVQSVLEAGEMPPEDAPPLPAEDKKAIITWYRQRLEAPVEALPGVFRPRRLSGPEYRNTLRSLFGFDLKVAVAKAEQTVAGEESLVLKLLPTDPPGASGFVNDTHSARLSSVIWDEYSHLGDAALETLFSKIKRESPAGFSRAQAETLIRSFVPRAMRRPVPVEQVDKMIAALDGKDGEALIAATKFELKAVLMSPAFLYRGILMEGTPGKQQPVDPFELAERLSYFLWEDMPDEELTEAAASGSLSSPDALAAQVERMLLSPKARSLAESFGVQWLGLDSLDELLQSDPIRLHALKTQPVDFLHYLFTEDRPVMEIIDSKITFVNQGTSGFYGKDRLRMTKYVSAKGIERQTTPNQRLTLVDAEGRGGILTMPGILTMNEGPIQRGTWMLRQILGEQLGDPPADTPPIEPSPRGSNLSFRERFEIHRSDVTCARCHEKIDPLGFAFEAYDKNGQYLLASDRKKGNKESAPINASGKLPSGEAFEDFAQLKSIFLTSQRETIVRNIVVRTLSYALCRKLERRDQPTVETITRNLCENNGTWKSLFIQTALSLPFRETIIIEKATTTHEQ